MRFYATTIKKGEYYYSAIVKGRIRIIFKEPFVNRKTALKHSLIETNNRNNK